MLMVLQAITNLPEKVGVTANLSLSYRAPTMADQVNYLIVEKDAFLSSCQFVVIKTSLQEVKGRKATVTGRVEDLKGTLLVEAT